MDTSHISLCSMHLNASLFDHYQCDQHISLGLSFVNLAKVLKCGSGTDMLTIYSEASNLDIARFTFKLPKDDKISEFIFKLMDIESEYLHIPDVEFDCVVVMVSVSNYKILTHQVIKRISYDNIRFNRIQ